MADFVYEDVTETYAGKILDVEDLNRMGLRGRSFYRPIPHLRIPGKIDMLLEQRSSGWQHSENIVYCFLPEEIKDSKQFFYDTLITRQPGMVKYNYHMDENVWRNLAATLSDEVEELGGFPIDTFGMLGELGYGTFKVFNDSLSQDFWGPPPSAPPDFTTCSVCLEGFLYDDNHFHEVLNLPCFHMFHKKCIFK
ncbi:unnamed protein product [Cochlearia groenlandica]